MGQAFSPVVRDNRLSINLNVANLCVCVNGSLSLPVQPPCLKRHFSLPSFAEKSKCYAFYRSDPSTIMLKYFITSKIHKSESCLSESSEELLQNVLRAKRNLHYENLLQKVHYSPNCQCVTDGKSKFFPLLLRIPWVPER